MRADWSLSMWLVHVAGQMATFPVETFSISLHPTGLSALVGFADKLRFVQLLNSGLKTVRPLRSDNGG